MKALDFDEEMPDEEDHDMGTAGAPTAEQRRLYRSRKERMLFGVCGGLAQYFNLDPVLVRLGFLLFGLGTGVGFIAYLVLAIVVPERPIGDTEPAVTSTADAARAQQLIGSALVILGFVLLASTLRVFDWDRYWPVLLIALGGLLLLRRNTFTRG
jgi:phage shock protein C